MKHRPTWILPITLLGVACSATPSVDPLSEDLGSSQEPERWSSGDDPSLFASNLERRLGALPGQGEASPIPWPGSYWRSSDDSINYRWDGKQSLSPAEKYELAFGGRGVEDRVSQAYGVDAHPNARPCSDDSDCNQSLHEVCGKRAAASAGRCLPWWYGICQGWAAASILLPEPAHTVTAGGVAFKVQDIKALLSVAHADDNARFISLRCTADDRVGAVRYDAFGRPTSSSCRDTNPGTFHVILANYLGIQRKSFIEDRTFDAQVWNQPLRGYRVIEQTPVSVAQANALLGTLGPVYMFDGAARSLVYVKNDVSYILESTSEMDGNLSSNIDYFTGHDIYEYILELDRSGAIIGGEWVGASQRNHPDFLWLPTGPGAATVAGIRFDLIQGLAQSAR